jgi:hypothetical protein
LFLRINGPTQGALRPDHDTRANRSGQVAQTRTVDGLVDTFEPGDRAVVETGPAGEGKGFFGRIFDAIGRFFSSIWAFITGKSTASSAQPDDGRERTTRRRRVGPPHRNRFVNRRRDVSPENALRRVATSATAPTPRVGTETRFRTADEVSRNTARVASGATFGGVPVRDVGQWYTNATGTAFGGALDPDDNGISAFGYRTGAGGREGVAIPQRIMAELTGTNSKSVHQQYRVEVTNHATGKSAVFDIVDRGPSEYVWRREGRPVVDLTEGAVAELGGTVVKNSRGQMVSTTGLNNLSFRIIRG